MVQLQGSWVSILVVVTSMGHLVQVPWLRGNWIPVNASTKELLPALCLPAKAIRGMSISDSAPTARNLLTNWIAREAELPRSSKSVLHAIPVGWRRKSWAHNTAATSNDTCSSKMEWCRQPPLRDNISLLVPTVIFGFFLIRLFVFSMNVSMYLELRVRERELADCEQFFDVSLQIFLISQGTSGKSIDSKDMTMSKVLRSWNFRISRFCGTPSRSIAKISPGIWLVGSKTGSWTRFGSLIVAKCLQGHIANANKTLHLLKFWISSSSKSKAKKSAFDACIMVEGRKPGLSSQIWITQQTSARLFQFKRRMKIKITSVDPCSCTKDTIWYQVTVLDLLDLLIGERILRKPSCNENRKRVTLLWEMVPDRLHRFVVVLLVMWTPGITGRATMRTTRWCKKDKGDAEKWDTRRK